jgi:hypothetical protein
VLLLLEFIAKSASLLVLVIVFLNALFSKF